MDPQLLIATTAITACTSGIIGAIVAAIVSAVRTKGHEAMDNGKAMQDGMKLLLMDKTKYLTACAVQDGEIAIHQRSFIHQMVDTAHALGANGEMTACAQEVDKLPTRVDG